MSCANCTTETLHLYRWWDGEHWMLLCSGCYVAAVNPGPWHDIVIRGDVPVSYASQSADHEAIINSHE